MTICLHSAASSATRRFSSGLHWAAISLKLALITYTVSAAGCDILSLDVATITIVQSCYLSG